MNPNRKKMLAARTLGVGMERIIFNTQRLDEVMEAITKQDIRDLVAAGAIMIKPIVGRKAVQRRTAKRGPGKVRKKVLDRKRVYIRRTRKLRAYIASLKDKDQITPELELKLRQEIKASAFRDLAHFKERIKEAK